MPTSEVSAVNGVKTFVHIVLVLLVFSTAAFSSAQSDIRKRDRELKKLRAEIDAYEQRIRESEKKERTTLERLDNIEQQTNLLKDLLEQLRDEEQQLRSTITLTRDNIAALEMQLSFLRTHYASYVASVYKYGRVYDFETLLSSKSINQLYIRMMYFKKFSDQRKKDLEKIGTKKSQIETEHASLQEKLSAEQALIEEKQTEERSLNTKRKRRTKTLAEVRKDKSLMQKELIRKTAAAKELENLIADLIDKERVRQERLRKEKLERERIAREKAERAAQERAAERERLKAAKESAVKPEPAIEKTEVEFSGIPFDERRGKLRWPVASGTIIAQFGNHIHPTLKTVTQNTGVDISVPRNTPIKSVADGEVALIHWLPSYGNLIIVNHYNGYRTVYAHLSEILVTPGQSLKEGSVIAMSGESVSGNVLHFEIWKEKEKQNPEFWLAHRR